MAIYLYVHTNILYYRCHKSVQETLGPKISIHTFYDRI